MSVMAAVLTLVLLAAVIVVVSGPLRAARTLKGTPSRAQAGKPAKPETPERAELQAAREAKYREIRDTELDYHTGKLSSVDFEAVNGALRAEAVEILDRLEAVERELEDEKGLHAKQETFIREAPKREVLPQEVKQEEQPIKQEEEPIKQQEQATPPPK